MNEMRPIMLEIRIISNLMKRKIECIKKNSQGSTFTGMQGFIIKYLTQNNNKDIFQKDIECEFQIRRSTATGILKLMEKNELIERNHVSYDARLKKIVLTQKAKDIHDKFLEDIHKIEENAESGLTIEEKETVLNILNKIKKNLE